MSDTATELRWDPFDTEIDTEPYEIWRRLRDEAPLYRNDEYDFWALSRYADVEAAHLDPVTFCSGHGTVLEMMTPEPFDTGQFIFVDPPEHTRLRSLASRAFTPRRVKELEGRIRELCAEMLEPHTGGGTFDFVQDFGAQLPSMVISSLFGVPPEEREEVRHHIDLVFHIEPGVGMINDVSLNAMIWLNEYLSRQLEQRRREPVDDMLTDLAHAEITDEDGTVRRLTDAQACDFANLVISAGTETVARLLGFAAVVLAENPEQREELAADRGLMPERDRGAPALRGAVARAGALDDPRRRAARRGRPRRLEGVVAHGRRRPRRAQVPRSRSVRHPPPHRPPRRIRLRHPLLSGGRAGAPRGARCARGDARAVPRMGSRLRGHRPKPHEHGARLREASRFASDRRLLETTGVSRWRSRGRSRTAPTTCGAPGCPSPPS